MFLFLQVIIYRQFVIYWLIEWLIEKQRISQWLIEKQRISPNPET